MMHKSIKIPSGVDRNLTWGVQLHISVLKALVILRFCRLSTKTPFNQVLNSLGLGVQMPLCTPSGYATEISGFYSTLASQVYATFSITVPETGFNFFVFQSSPFSEYIFFALRTVKSASSTFCGLKSGLTPILAFVYNVPFWNCII